jgi:hypothetical protein
MNKVLAVLVNYGDGQLNYLEQVVNSLKSFKKYEVTVIVNSNIPLDIKGIDHINVIKLKNYQLLPLTCRRVLWDHREDFDIFIFGENDHLFLEHHIDRHLEYIEILPKNRISGLIQHEDNQSVRYYPAYHGRYGWDYNSVEDYSGKKFAHFTNIHQASFIITQEQLFRIGQMHDFTQFFGDSHYSLKCKVNTDIYQFCDMQKVICISDFKDNVIHHLPDKYIDHSLKIKSDKEMQDDLLNLLNK